MVAAHPGDIRATTRFATTQPEETIRKAIQYLRDQISPTELKGLGIGSFGPLDLDPDSSTYGFLTTTPKSGWADTDLLHPFQEAFNLPTGFDTDVNTAALGEAAWGAGQLWNHVSCKRSCFWPAPGAGLFFSTA